MKKVLSILLVLLLLAGCSSNNTEPTAPASSVPASSEAPAATLAPAPALSEAELAAIHPMLFRVTGANGETLYLFGTIHVGDDRSLVVRDKLSKILDEVDALAVEFDIVAFEQDLVAQTQMITQFLYTDGTRISDHLPQDLYDQTVALLTEVGAYSPMLDLYNTALWSQLAEQALLMLDKDIDVNAGMDCRLIEACYALNKPVLDVESPELQYGLMASFSEELNILQIRSALENRDAYAENVNQLYTAWLDGDYENLRTLLEAEDEEGTEDYTEEEQALIADYNDKMLTQRNLGMRDKAVEWLQEGKTVLFAVGTAHLVGEGGLVELLRAAGYTVEQIAYQK